MSQTTVDSKELQDIDIAEATRQDVILVSAIKHNITKLNPDYSCAASI